MTELATKPMRLEEFLRWDDGTETHYELFGGHPLAIALAFEAHRVLAVRLGSRIETALCRRRPCTAQINAGLIPLEPPHTFFVADIAATCAAIEPERQAVKDPFLIVEILSPSTERHDRRVKLPVYRQIESVEEIVLIASDGLYAELHRRSGPQWIIEILHGREAVFSLSSVGIEIPFAELYDGIALSEADGGTATDL
jgi:Uma2 family endonuclease